MLKFGVHSLSYDDLFLQIELNERKEKVCLVLFPTFSWANPNLCHLFINGLVQLKVLTLLIFSFISKEQGRLTETESSPLSGSLKYSLDENGGFRFQGQCCTPKAITQHIWFLSVAPGSLVQWLVLQFWFLDMVCAGDST